MTLKELRQRQGISLFTLAALLGVTGPGAYGYERGTYKPKRRVQPLYAKVLGVTMDELQAAIEATRQEVIA